MSAEERAIAEGAKQGRSFVVGGFVVRGDTLLLLKRSAHECMGGLWELPSGGVEAGESFDEALVREFFEETGLRVRSIGPYINHFDYASSRQFNYIVEVEDGVVVLSDEHEEWGYFAPSAVELDAAMRSVVEDFFARLSENERTERL